MNKQSRTVDYQKQTVAITSLLIVIVSAMIATFLSSAEGVAFMYWLLGG